MSTRRMRSPSGAAMDYLLRLGRRLCNKAVPQLYEMPAEAATRDATGSELAGGASADDEHRLARQFAGAFAPRPRRAVPGVTALRIEAPPPRRRLLYNSAMGEGT